MYYPGMVTEPISGNLSNVSKVNNILFKKRKGGDNNSVATLIDGEENSVITPIKKKKKHKM